MKELKLTCGATVFLDDEDYDRIPKTGWYLSPLKRDGTERNTRYAVHDTYGKMHRFILGLTAENKNVVDHIDRNGLNNQKENLRVTTSGTNKKNQKTTKANKLNFNGIAYERATTKTSARIRCRWSEGPVEYKYGGYRAKQKVKNFPLSKMSIEEAVAQAILYRLKMMRENDYLIDESSTTIEKRILNGDNIEEILGINLKDFK